MKKLNIILIVVLIFTTSCKEDEVTTIITGSVKDYYAGTSIPNIDLHIKKISLDPRDAQLRQNQPYDTTSYFLKIRVDENGNFSLNSELLEEGEDYLLTYLDHEKFSIYSNAIKAGESNHFNMKVKYYNTLKVFIDNSVEADRIELKLAVDNAHFDETGEIVHFLMDYTFDPGSLTSCNSLRSIPDCSHNIHVKYYLDNKYIDQISLNKVVSNTDTTTIRIELL